MFIKKEKRDRGREGERVGRRGRERKREREKLRSVDSCMCHNWGSNLHRIILQPPEPPGQGSYGMLSS